MHPLLEHSDAMGRRRDIVHEKRQVNGRRKRRGNGNDGHWLFLC
jgi:hypothetical protein